MNERSSTSRIIFTIFAALTCTASLAIEIDYDPRRPGELRPCDQDRYRGRDEQAQRCYSELLASSSNPLVQAESAWRSHDIRSANELFREYIGTDADEVYGRIRWGHLFLQTHQYGQAVELFREALQLAPDDAYAKLGLARVYADRFEGGAEPLLAEILDADDKMLGAHLLIARMALEEGDFEQAQKSITRAAALASKQQHPPLEVLALRAALELSRNRDPEPTLNKLHEHNPHYGAAYEQLAHFEIMRRRYREATHRLRQAIAAQPQLWSAHAELGLNLMRLGDIEEARTHLTTAYSGDPYSPIIVNSLRLLDRIDQFELLHTEVSSGDRQIALELRLHEDEAQALQPYVAALASEAIETFSDRYGFILQDPVTLELYPDHDDFAVRVAALPGIGLLGVTFGSVVAMDSPSGRARGDFHWGSTLWHEMAHVFTLEATDHRVPRWLSEGISVFEEWRTGPTRGVAIPPEVFVAFRDDKLLPISELDSGFIRPSYPNQIQVSYVQAGLVCLFIEENWDFQHLVSLLKQFTKATSTDAAIQATFKISPAAFDREYRKFMAARFETTLENFDEWANAHETAQAALQSEQWDEVIEPARRALRLYPEHVGPGSPALALARASDKLGHRDEAIDALQSYRKAGGWDPAAMLELARWLEEAARPREVTEVLQAMNYVDPLAPDLHARLGERLLSEGRAQEALREFRVLQALRKTDQAPALFGAARALRALGEHSQSRRHLLDALAEAPHYRPAQALLLETTQERARNE